MNDSPRRLLLRVAVKLMFLASIGLFGYALFSSVDQHEEAKTDFPPPLQIRLQASQATHIQRIPWSGGNLLLLWRSPGINRALTQNTDKLLDPQSADARQPPALPSPDRSYRPSLFIAYDRSTDLGCPLQWVAPGNREAPLQPWPGGLRDSCGGSWYDAAGRVLKNQQAGRNLDIPPYRFIEPDLLEVGVNGDNPASTK